MPAPKDINRTPIKRGIVYVKKAHSWLYYETFNHENTPDKMEFFDTEEQAKARYERG